MTPKRPTPARSRTRETLAVVLPLMLATFTGTLCDFACTVFAARFSHDVMCAALPAAAIAATFTAFLSAVVAIAGTIVAREHGAGEHARAQTAFRQGLLLAVLTAPLFLLAVPAGDCILGLAAHSDAMRPLEHVFLRYQLGAGFFVVLYTALAGLFSGQGRTGIISATSVAGSAVSAILSAVLIGGFDGMPALGIHGLGIAALAGKAVACLSLMPSLFKDPLFPRGRGIGGLFAPDKPVVREIIRKGLPAGASVLVLSGAFMLFTLVTGRLDAVSVAAVNICIAVNGFYWVFVLAAEQAVTILAGRALGADDVQGARAAVRKVAVILSVPIACFCVVCLAATDAITGIFHAPGADVDMAALTSTVRWFIAAFIVRDILEAGCHLLSGALTAALDTGAILAARLAANVIWIALVAAAFFLRPALSSYAALAPVQMGMVFVPLLIRWRRCWKRAAGQLPPQKA